MYRPSGGSGWGYQPIPEHIPFGRPLTENGSDILFGHSCHISHSIEIYRGRPILYSTGDFVDDYAVDEIERDDESFIFVVETSSYRVTGLRLYPTVICHMKARCASPSDETTIAA